MGLDQYLFRATKKRKDAIVKFKELCTQYRARVSELDKSERGKKLWDSLPWNEAHTYFENKDLTDEQIKEMEFFKEEYTRIANEIGIRIDSGFNPKFVPSDFGLTKKDDNYEIAYWRKEWELHNFIVQNFGNPKDDNLVEVWLDKEAIQKIIDAGYFQKEFRRALKKLDDDHVVFYWPWY